MPRVVFTQNLQRHLAAAPATVPASSVGEALDAIFEDSPKLRGYVLDDQGAVRKHVTIFVDGEPLGDRDGLATPVGPDAEIYVLQALSGG